MKQSTDSCVMSFVRASKSLYVINLKSILAYVYDLSDVVETDFNNSIEAIRVLNSLPSDIPQFF